MIKSSQLTVAAEEYDEGDWGAKQGELASSHPDDRHIHSKLSHYSHLLRIVCLKQQRPGKSITEIFVLRVWTSSKLVLTPVSAFGYYLSDVLSQVERDILLLVLILKLEQLFVGSMFW